MSNADVSFVSRLLKLKVNEGFEYSRPLFAKCYLSDLSERGVQEALEVSEKWIDFYWQRLGPVPFGRLEQIYKQGPAKMAEFLATKLS
jgi:hypothetical protein